MIKELGYCPGILKIIQGTLTTEKGERPFCLFDYFHDDFLFVIDEKAT